MELLAALAKEKEAAVAAMRESGLSPRAFGVHWALKDDPVLKDASIPTLDMAQEVEKLLDRFPNAAVNTEEKKRLRAALYRPLLQLKRDERSRAVERIFTILLGADADAEK